jgi:hypothetical protein
MIATFEPYPVPVSCNCLPTSGDPAWWFRLHGCVQRAVSLFNPLVNPRCVRLLGMINSLAVPNSLVSYFSRRLLAAFFIAARDYDVAVGLVSPSANAGSGLIRACQGCPSGARRAKSVNVPECRSMISVKAQGASTRSFFACNFSCNDSVFVGLRPCSLSPSDLIADGLPGGWVEDEPAALRAAVISVEVGEVEHAQDRAASEDVE